VTAWRLSWLVTPAIVTAALAQASRSAGGVNQDTIFTLLPNVRAHAEGRQHYFLFFAVNCCTSRRRICEALLS
jgi:hypothetical protein